MYKIVSYLPGVSFCSSTWAGWLSGNGKFTRDKCSPSRLERREGLRAGSSDPKPPRTKPTRSLPLQTGAPRLATALLLLGSARKSICQTGPCHISRKQTRHPLPLTSPGPVTKCSMRKSGRSSCALLPWPRGREAGTGAHRSPPQVVSASGRALQGSNIPPVRGGACAGPPR